MTHQRLGIVLVAYGNEATFESLLTELSKQKSSGDEIVVIDNHAKQLCADIAEGFSSVDSVIRSENVGFARGVNKATQFLSKNIDVVFLLNPDTMPEPKMLDAVRNGRPGWGAWMALLTLSTGRVNSAGNVLHTSGLSWCGDYDLLPSEITLTKQGPNLLSGACMAIRKEIWDQLGGFEELYYMYYEDASLSLSVRSMGFGLGVLPKALVQHDYDYKKSSLKWFYIERNRYLLILEHWPAPVLLLYLPYLLIIEIGLWGVSILQRRSILKLKSSVSLIKLLPKVIILRRNAQRRRTINSYAFLQNLEPSINTPLLGVLSRARFINWCSRSYYSAVKSAIGLGSR